MPLGIDSKVVDSFDYQLAIKRIKNDLQTDFIYSPHLSAIFYKAPDDLWEFLSEKLKNGKYNPKLPFILEVPKENKFTRPGSILWPCERLIYQVSVDTITPTAEKTLDRSRVFSYVPLKEDPDGFMFKPPEESYSKFDYKKQEYITSRKYSYVLKADVSCYFERLNQHMLINSLFQANCVGQVVEFLEKLLSSFTQKDSRGIIQGIFPSDYLGTYYLCQIDTQYGVNDIPSIRYVDDIYAFFNNSRSAEINKIQLSQWLRPLGLNLNESKTDIIPVKNLIREKTEIDRLMESAKEEAFSQLGREDFYSSTIPWDFIYEDVISDGTKVNTPNLEVTRKLFNQTDVSPDIQDTICLRNFTAAKDDIAVDYVLQRFPTQPHMAQKYAKYLKSFVNNNDAICREVERIFGEKDLIYDFQVHWLYALLMYSANVKNKTVELAYRHLTDAKERSEVTRAVSAVFIGKFGGSTLRELLRSHYANETSLYVRSAIIYALRYFPTRERDICFRSWAGHDEIFPLIIAAVRKIKDEADVDV